MHSLSHAHIIDTRQSSGSRPPKSHVVAGFEDDEMSEDEMNLDTIPSFEMPSSPKKFTPFKLDPSPVSDTTRLANPEISPNYITSRIDDLDTEDTPERDLIDLDDTESTISSLYPASSDKLSGSAYSMSSIAQSSRSSINLVTPEPEDDQPFFKVNHLLDRELSSTRSSSRQRYVSQTTDGRSGDNWMAYHPVNDPLPPPAPIRPEGSFTLADIAKRKRPDGSGPSALRPKNATTSKGYGNHKILPLEPKFDDWQAHVTVPTPKGRGGTTLNAGDDWGSPDSRMNKPTQGTVSRFGGW